MVRDTEAIEKRLAEIVEEVERGDEESNSEPLENIDAFERLLRQLCLDGGLSPSAARANALVQLAPEFARKADAARHAGVSGGAFRRTDSDAREEIEAAERLYALTRDDLPCAVVADFEVETGAEPVTDQDRERVIVGEYLPIGYRSSDAPGLQYVVIREQYSRFSEQYVPDDTQNRWGFVGSQVSRYEDAADLEEGLIEEMSFVDRDHQLAVLSELERAGFRPESTFSRNHEEGDSVVYEGDTSDDEVLRECRDEEVVIVEQSDERSFVLECPDVIDPETDEPVQFATVDYRLRPTEGEW